MKKKLLVAALLTSAATATFAQSAFQGFYGQVATGYESNSTSNMNSSASDSSGSVSLSASNQNFGGTPLVIGIGYNFTVAPQWLVGIGADYSVLSQTSSTFSSSSPDPTVGTVSGQSVKASNRYNIFVTPGYAIDKDKLVYLKAGYSSLSATANWPTSYVDSGGSGSTGLSGGQSKTVSGYVVGLGYKQIITGGIYGFAEGNYMSYSKPSFSTSNSSGTTISSNPSINSYQLLVGVGYKF